MARAYRMSEALREKLNQVWYSEKLGRTYSSEKRMRAAEAASERMKKNAIIESIEAKLPISWERLQSNKWKKRDWADYEEDSIFRRIFYKGGYQDGNWTEIASGTIKEYYKDYGLDDIDQMGHTFRDFIKDILPDDILTEDEWKKVNDLWGEIKYDN